MPNEQPSALEESSTTLKKEDGFSLQELLSVPLNTDTKTFTEVLLKTIQEPLSNG